MKKLAVLALVAAPLLASGCVSERTYDNFDGLEPSLVAELFGQAGVLRPIDKQFSAEQTSGLFTREDSFTLNDYGNSLAANIFVQEPEGRAYIDVNIDNYDRMELGQPYTVQLQGDAENGYYESEDVNTDEPRISVYACPEDINGPTGQSGNAQEITVIREQGNNGGDVFTFDAQADNPRQELFLDGWFRTGPATVGGSF